MKEYPKIPHEKHDFFPEEFFHAPDIVAVEKADGQNIRFIVYDERYEHMYTEEIHNFQPKHGDLFIGTKSQIRGRVNHDTELSGQFNRLKNHLQKVSVDKILEKHKKYDSALVFFGEHMVKHSLNYNYDSNPPDPFIGFDIFKMSEYTPETKSKNPYDHTFEGFLRFTEMVDVFTDVELEVAHIISDSIEPPLDLSDYKLPTSKYRDGKPEGVVFRSDTVDRRLKYVREDMEEINSNVWGIRSDIATTGEELFEARYLTTSRITKHVHKQLNKRGSVNVQDLAEQVVYDIWEEEMYEIASFEKPFKPQKIYDIAKSRCENVVDVMKTNAQLNNTEITEIWNQTSDDEVKTGAFEVSTEEINKISTKVEEMDYSREKSLVKYFITEQQILDVAEKISKEKGKELGNWVIPEVKDDLYDEFWYGNKHLVANYPHELQMNKLDRELMNIVAEIIQEET